MSGQDGFYTRLYKLQRGAKAEALSLPMSIGSFDVAKDGAQVLRHG